MDGLIGYKANLSPAKLKLADIGLELSLAKMKVVQVHDVEFHKIHLNSTKNTSATFTFLFYLLPSSAPAQCQLASALLG